MAYTRSKKAPKKAKTRARKLALAGSAKARAKPASKRPTKPPAETHSDTDEDLIGAANNIVDELGKITRSLEKPKASFWKKHGGNVAVVIRRIPSFDPSRYQCVDDLVVETPPSSFKKVRFDKQVEEIGSPGGMSGILTAAKFGDSDSDDQSSDSDKAELSEDELSESFHHMTRSRAQTQPRKHAFSIVIKSSPALSAPITTTPATTTPRVTRHASTTRHQFRLAVTGNPDAVPSSMMDTPTSDARSVRSLIHSRIDDKYAASRTRATATAAAMANRTAPKAASNVKKTPAFTTGIVQKATHTNTRRSSGRIAARASKAIVVEKDEDEDGEDKDEEDEEDEEGEDEEEGEEEEESD